MWVDPRAGAQEAVRRREVDTGVVAWRAQGAIAKLVECICVVGGLGGEGCARKPKLEFQPGFVLCIKAAAGARSNRTKGERGKSLRW